MRPIIYLDERERGEIRTAFDKFDCEIRISTLPVADYVISSEIGIERKRGDDFAGSLCDNRFFRQLLNLKTTFSKPLLILENFSSMFDRDILRNALYGALIYVQYKLNISIIPTENELETARTIWSLARFFQKDQTFSYEPNKDLSPTISRQNQIDFLEGLLQVSQKKADILLSHFQTPGATLQALWESGVESSSSKRSKKVTGPYAQLKGFGPKFIKTNLHLLTSEFKS